MRPCADSWSRPRTTSNEPSAESSERSCHGIAQVGRLAEHILQAAGQGRPRPLAEAAQVHIMNADKQVLFMVYTSAGRYRAPNLFPGKYEVTVRKAGFGADTQTITLAAGAKATLDFSLREQAGPGVRQGEFGFTSGAGTDVKLLSYDELYPRESGRVLLEKNCMYCHGKNFFPSKQYQDRKSVV